MSDLEWSEISGEEFYLPEEEDLYSHLFTNLSCKLSPILDDDCEEFEDDYDTIDEMECIVE